ncbi:MAG: hypothetical protein IJ567_06760 [Lachnospiraceae bacterium]|nr:hypothetical protein [Lachnospiraceae bacterium]
MQINQHRQIGLFVVKDGIAMLREEVFDHETNMLPKRFPVIAFREELLKLLIVPAVNRGLRKGLKKGLFLRADPVSQILFIFCIVLDSEFFQLLGLFDIFHEWSPLATVFFTNKIFRCAMLRKLKGDKNAGCMKNTTPNK